MMLFKRMAVFLAVGGVVLMSFTACNLFMSDEEIINKMMAKMTEIDSYSSETKISGSFVVENVPSLDFLLNMTGESLMKNNESENNLNVASAFNLKGDINAEGQTMSFDADLKMIDSVMYFKLNSLPMIPMMDFSEFTGQWISLDFNALAEFNAIKTGETSNVDFASLMNYAYELSENLNIFKLKEDLGTAKVGNNRVYHYSVDIDKAVIVDMMVNLALKVSEEQNLTEEEINQAKLDLNKAFELFNFKNIELFIDKSDFYLRRMVMDMEMGVPQDSSLGAVDASATFGIDMIYDNFNKVGEITAPESSQSFEELMNSFLPQTPNNVSGELSAEASNLDELSAEEEAMLNEFLSENPEIDLE